MKKRMISVLLVLALAVGSCPAVVAVEATPSPAYTEEEMDSILLQRGYPQIYLEHLAPSAKESLCNKPDAVFAGATISTYDEETGVFNDYDVSADGIALCGQIPDSDLSLTWGIAKYTTSNNVLVTYSYQWNTYPFYRGQDPIGVAWDENCFRLVDDSFYKVDQYYFPNISTPDISSESRKYANASDSGVTWYADLTGMPGSAYKLFGHGEFLLQPQQKGPFTTTFYGHYVHSLASVGLSLSIPKFGGSFSVSGFGGYDELGNQRTYTYR